MYLQTSLEKNFFKLPIKLLTLRKRLLCFLLVIFSPRHNKNERKALNVEHLVRGWLEKLVHLQLFQMAHKLPRHWVGTHKRKYRKKLWMWDIGHLNVIKSKTWNLEVTTRAQEKLHLDSLLGFAWKISS